MITEEFMYSDYEYTPMKPSVLVPGKLVPDTDNTVYICPVCDSSQKPLEHGESRQCYCGVTAVRIGNNLALTEES